MAIIKEEDLLNLNEEDLAEKLFADENRLLTSDFSDLEMAKGHQDILALFADGTFIVSETHKFDGRVFAFKSLMEKGGYEIHDPIYLGMRLLSSLYQNESRFLTIDNKNQQRGNFKNEMQKAYVDIIAKAAKLHVSDVHVVVGKETSVIFRMDGTMQTVLEYNGDWGEAFVRSVFASADISDSNYSQNEFQAGQKLGDTPIQGDTDLYLPSNVLAIRLQFNPIAFGSQYLVMRLLYANTSSDNDDLKAGGFTELEDKQFQELRASPTGIVVVSGPTGSGKSTTLQRNMIKYLKENNYEVNLITVEDPPEYPIPGARQMPVTNAENEEEKEEAFIKALAASLRSDPDSLMIGEVRTLSAAELAFKGALSGHNVWTTLHANSGSAIILRLMDMGVEPFKLKDPEIMRGLTAQRLFKTLCPNCKKRLSDHPEMKAYQRMLRAYGDIGLQQTSLKGDGCEQCDYKGITGRTVCSEVIIPDNYFLELMTVNRSSEAMKYWINELSGRTLKEAAVEKMFKGLISIEEVERWCGFIDRYK